MSAYSNIDIETFNWVKSEIGVSIEAAKTDLQSFVVNDDTERLLSLGSHLHQVVGSLQMLELKALSTLLLESERLLAYYTGDKSNVGKSSLVVLIDSAFAALNETIERISAGLPESPVEVVELINQIRSARGEQDIEISSLFSPMIEVFPEVDSSRALKDQVYIQRISALRKLFQSFLLKWLRDNDLESVQKMGLVLDKASHMSTFSAVSRLWWVATAYVDFILNNELKNKAVHGRILRKVDDQFRVLELQGESALVRDPGDELVKIMLFYVGVAKNRSERMEQISDAFALQDYFPALVENAQHIDMNELTNKLALMKDNLPLPVSAIRQLVGSYFEGQTDVSQLLEIADQIEQLSSLAEEHNVDIVLDLCDRISAVIKGLRNGSIDHDSDTSFHMASAVMFIETGLDDPTQVDKHWIENGKLRIKALEAIINHEQIGSEFDGTQLTGSERQALLDEVSQEVDENLRHIEANLELFSNDFSQLHLLEGVDQEIRQVRGALQVLGEHKVSLLLQLAEEQFIAIKNNTIEPKEDLVEALAVAIGTMEDYVRGLQAGRTSMDHLLDQSISDLEVAIGKKVSRDDVEELLEESSDSLFSWLSNQSEFDLFTKLKSNLRDLRTLARKTKLQEMEHLISEQNRLVDIISQEPAFLTDNITANLQNNMGSITEQIIQLYGTQETAEEQALDEEQAYRRSAIHVEDGGAAKIHDDMDLSELGDDAPVISQEPNDTAADKQHVVAPQPADTVDDTLLDVFVEESRDVIDEANRLYLICSQDLNERTSIRDLRRAFHTLKGSSRMVGLNNIGEVAWCSESLFNYVLDTEKPLTVSVLNFARESLDEFGAQLSEKYQNQQLIDVDFWGEKTDSIVQLLKSGEQIESKESAPPSEEQEQKEDQEVEPVKVQETEAQGSVTDSDTEPEQENIDILDEIVFAEDTAVNTDAEEIELSFDGDIVQQDDLSGGVDAADKLEFTVPFSESPSIEAASFSVIDDVQMREVFRTEAKSHLAQIRQSLGQKAASITEDDALSISIHTFLGNARTLELTSVANAYQMAETFCQTKQELKTPLSEQENGCLSDLLEATDALIDSESDEAPYYHVDEENWSAITSRLDYCNQQAPSNIELNHELELDDDLELDELNITEIEVSEIELSDPLDDVIELIVDEGTDPVVQSEGALNAAKQSGGIVEDEAVENELKNLDWDIGELEEDDEVYQIELVDDSPDKTSELNINEPPLSVEQSVANSFKNIDNLDDILTSEPKSQRDEFDDLETDLEQFDELDEIEKSLQAFSLEQPAQRQENIDEAAASELVDLSLEVNEMPNDGGLDEHVLDEQVPDERQSLLPGELTNLVQEDLLQLETAIGLELSNEQTSKLKLDEETSIDDLDTKEDLILEEGEGLNDSPVDDPEVLADEKPFADKEPSAEKEPSVEDANISESEGLVIEVENLLETEEDGQSADQFNIGEKTQLTPEQDESKTATPESAALDPELKEIFINELSAIHDDLDNEVAKLKSLADSAPAMANILRHLHTIKGSALMASANELGEVTHQTESYLESSFIRSEDDLKVIRTTLEKYLDGVDDALTAYRTEKEYLVSNELADVIDYQPSLGQSHAPEKPNQADQTEEADIHLDGDASAAAEEPTAKAVDEAVVEDKVESTPDIDEASNTEQPVFVPGSREDSEQALTELAEQSAAASDRAAALRIRTETLDSLTNYVGDASMNRAQMREDVTSVKSVVDRLYENIQSLGTQLRELEIEADSRITSRTSAGLQPQVDGEFDPLEMDRYTKLQQLSRGLTDNLDSLNDIQSSLSGFINKSETSLQKQDRLNRDLQDEILQVRLVSFGGIAPQLRQIVRRTANELDKQVELEIIGSDVRMDKTILDGVVPALEHMLRNAVDHGIESAAQRRKKGKSKMGHIEVECRQVAREIVISIRDDGRGLDLEAIRAKAIEDHLMTEDQALDPQDVMLLISQSGFSTAKELTHISGRGVGMDVVQTTLRRMSGSINYDVDNENAGSQFTINLPISLAVSSAIFIQAGDVPFAVSARTIERVVNIEVEELIQHLKMENPSIEVSGVNYSLIDLADYLGYSTKISMLEGKLSVILVNAGVQNIAVIIEKLEDTQEIVVKDIGSHLGRIPIYAGATIRANGQVVMLLDLVGISYYESYISIPELSEELSGGLFTIPSVMVVDDSLTVRKSAERDISGLGINVVLAKDGLDAQVQLRQEVPDMILLDIEMPNMDGFELLEWIKSEEATKNIPVAMISSRATEKYVEKASELGCSAFLGKPYLLENLVAVFNQHLTLDEPIMLD